MKRKIIDPNALRALAADGKTIPEIAELLDFSKSGVRHCCELHGIKPTLAPHGRKAGFKVKTVKPNPFDGMNRVPTATTPPVTPNNRKLSDETAAHEARALAEIKQATHADERPCVTHKPTPVEALTLKIKLPWIGKVEQQTPADLAPDLYDELVAYGAGDIAEMFGFTPEGFEVWLKKYGYPTKSPEPVPAVEHDLTIKPRAGQTFAGRKKEMDAELFRAHNYPDHDGLNYADRHFLGIDAPHAPTPAELTDIFVPEPPVGLLQTAERLADLISQREHLQQEERLVAGMIGKIDASIEECLKIIQEAAR